MKQLRNYGFIFVCMLGILIMPQPLLAYEIEDITAVESHILSYMSENDINVAFGTTEYEIFLRDVIYWNLHPDLSNGELHDSIYNYARQYLQPDGGFGPDLPIDAFDTATLIYDVYLPLIISPENDNSNIVAASVVSNYDGQAAANYALKWSNDGQITRVPGHPNFSNDCTGFASQAIEVGGFAQNGTGSCVTEWVTDEWYVTDSSWRCKAQPWRSSNDYAWSATWSVAGWFAYHNRHHKVDEHNGRKGFWVVNQDNLHFLRMWGDIGEVVQIINGATYNDIYHTMIITDRKDGEIYLTYHTGPEGKDVENISLEDLSSRLDDSHRFILLEYFW